MKRGYVDTPEGQVHYRTEGSGEPLLLLHEVGVGSDQYTEMIPFLGRRYLVLAMDILGYGNSAMPPHGVKVQDYARNAVHFLDALNIKKSSVVGYLTGASVAVEMAVAYPQRVNKLVLSNCIYAEPEARQQRLEFFIRKRAERESMEIKKDGSHLMELWHDRMQYHYQTPEMAERALINHLSQALGRRLHDGHVAAFSYDIGPRLAAIRNPTLLLYGTGDKWITRLEAVRQLLPQSRTKIIEGTGHVPQWEKPGEFSEAILQFLEK